MQGTVETGAVPTAAEVASGFTNLSDLDYFPIERQTDSLSRTIPKGTVVDPATTRFVTAGQLDPTSGLVATGTGYVRDPFGTWSSEHQNLHA